jgi:signal transduction histidine kinase
VRGFFRSTFLLFFAALILLSCSNEEKPPKIEIKVPDLSIYKHRQTKEVIQLVYDAVNEIELKDVSAFAQFRIEGSKWFHDDIYIFVWEMDGTRFVYPPEPSKEGKNMLSLTDQNGKPIGREIVQAAEQGEGWVFYRWNKPRATEPSLKSTFVKQAVDHDGIAYLVGCGLYDMPLEKVLERQVTE